MGKALRFPEGFVWGTSTAGHQIEGWNDNSDWWAFEQKGLIRDGSTSGKAVDYWNKYEDDHALMSELGYPAFRLGLEWAKIEPSPGKFSDDAMERYRSILASLRKRNIKICLTLNHWVLPMWVAEQKDWMNPKTLDDFQRFVTHVVEQLGEYPDMWVTLNEPMVPAIAGNLADEFPPQRKNYNAFRRVGSALLEAHARTYRIIHSKVPKAPDGGPTLAGIAQAYQWIVPWGTPGLAGQYEKIAAFVFKRGSFDAWDLSVQTGKQVYPFGGRFIANLRNSYDYCGINYYFRMSVKYDKSRKDQLYVDEKQIPDGIERTQMGWQVYPPGFYLTIKRVFGRFRKPIYILENGVADDADTMRPRYLLQHLAAVHRAISEGVPVKGYYQWSFTDNFEWREGFCKQFGLVGVDHADPELKRVPRRSAHMYSEIIRANGITEEIVAKYAPEAMDAVFGNTWDWTK